MQRNSKIISRLTALWALSEAGLGGVLHALQLPITGLLVGGFAIVLVSLIAYFADNKWRTIVRSLLVVLIIKLAVSPHSPPTAYFAVGFQAFMAGVIYSKLKLNMWSAMLLGVVTMVESAIQKLLVLLLIFGKSLLDSVNEFSEVLANNFTYLGDILSIQALVSVYLWAYAIMGVIVGYIIFDIVRYLEYNQGNVKYQIQAIEFDDEVGLAKKNRGRWRKWVVFGIFFSVIAMYYFFIKDGDAVWKNWLYIFIRSTGVLLVWYYVLAPVFKRKFTRFLEGKQHKVQKEVDETLTLLPYLRKVTKLAWKENRDEKGLAKLRNFMGDTILYSIHLQIDE